MTHDELQEKLRKAMGGKIPPAARETWGLFLKSKGEEYFLRYEWIKVKGFYKWILECEDVEFGEGSIGVRVWIETVPPKSPSPS